MVVLFYVCMLSNVWGFYRCVMVLYMLVYYQVNVGVWLPFSRNRLGYFSSTDVTGVIACNSEKECILSEFNYSVLFVF